MNLQKIHVKLLSNAAVEMDLVPVIGIFARWREGKDHRAAWVDLADYAHVPRGPGIVLVGHRASVAVDMEDPAPGVLYMTRKGLEGTAPARIRTALREALKMAAKLTAEKEFPAGVELRTNELELRFADRLETPNTPETDAKLLPAIEAALDALYGAGRYEMTREADGRRFYGYSVRAAKAEGLEELIQRLG